MVINGLEVGSQLHTPHTAAKKLHSHNLGMCECEREYVCVCACVCMCGEVYVVGVWGGVSMCILAHLLPIVVVCMFVLGTCVFANHGQQLDV